METIDKEDKGGRRERRKEGRRMNQLKTDESKTTGSET